MSEREGEGIVPPIDSLAFSMFSSRGTYALLVGSGLSREADIPTGWDIVEDLVERVAVAKGDTVDGKPEGWYREQFGKEPNYSELLAELSPSPGTRRDLIKRYIEPTEEDREEGRKIPTKAHEGIAELMAMGFLRVVITTNFDKLLEQACESQGIQPTIIYNSDSANGASPLVHSGPTIIKVHGDYLDARIKNTEEELQEYSPEMESLIKRVFDEFGLVVCGWSGQWDMALRDAILNTPNRRYPAFWVARGQITDQAQGIIKQREASVIWAEGAGSFFRELVEKVRSLDQFGRPHPLSTAMAVGRAKRYIPRPEHRVELHDLLMEEAEQASGKIPDLIEKSLNNPSSGDRVQSYKEILEEYEAAIERLLPMVGLLAYHGRGESLQLLGDVLEKVGKVGRRDSGLTDWLKLGHYPTLLLFYAGGVASVRSRNFPALKTLLYSNIKPVTGLGDGNGKAVGALSAFDVMAEGLTSALNSEPLKALSGPQYVFQKLSAPLSYIPLSGDAYWFSFLEFEVFLALERTRKEEDETEIETPHLMPGLYVRYLQDRFEKDPVSRLEEVAREEGNAWGAFEAGLLGGNLARFSSLLEDVEPSIQEYRRQMRLGRL